MLSSNSPHLIDSVLELEQVLDNLHMLIHFTKGRVQAIERQRSCRGGERLLRVPRVPENPWSPLVTKWKMTRSSCSMGRNTTGAVELINSHESKPDRKFSTHREGHTPS